jgi:hypothetical protein
MWHPVNDTLNRFVNSLRTKRGAGSGISNVFQPAPTPSGTGASV